jgi:hypothetical protein
MPKCRRLHKYSMNEGPHLQHQLCHWTGRSCFTREFKAAAAATAASTTQQQQRGEPEEVGAGTTASCGSGKMVWPYLLLVTQQDRQGAGNSFTVQAVAAFVAEGETSSQFSAFPGSVHTGKLLLLVSAHNCQVFWTACADITPCPTG